MNPVVAVYGRRAATGTKPVRLGAGTLPIRDLALPDEILSTELSGPNPPTVTRVGIGWLIDGAVRVQVIDVAQVMLSEPGVGSGPQIWGFDLAESAELPGEDELSRSTAPSGPPLREIDVGELLDRLRPRHRFPTRPIPGFPPRRTEPDPPEDSVIIIPAGLWCYLFPRASFCR